MTDFERVRAYYGQFDENKRLSADASGRLEFEMTMRILKRQLPKNARILDLGGATGAYSFPLAELGHEVWLADLSETLVGIARTKNAEGKLKACDIVNATDLSRYDEAFFDVVLLFGPLYHLTEEKERAQCLRQVRRVLKKGGLVFAAFIPRLSGSIAIVDRYLRHPEQVNAENMLETFETGRFRNASAKGFQEGYYPGLAEIEGLFETQGFRKRMVRSIRGFGYEKEDQLYAIRDAEMLEKVMALIERTAEQTPIIETCGHAVYIGERCE